MYEKLYRELLLRYNELERENKRLSEENLQLRRQLGFAEARLHGREKSHNMPADFTETMKVKPRCRYMTMWIFIFLCLKECIKNE